MQINGRPIVAITLKPGDRLLFEGTADSDTTDAHFEGVKGPNVKPRPKSKEVIVVVPK
jgi:hypothetical protein